MRGQENKRENSLLLRFGVLSLASLAGAPARATALRLELLEASFANLCESLVSVA